MEICAYRKDSKGLKFRALFLKIELQSNAVITNFNEPKLLITISETLRKIYNSLLAMCIQSKLLKIIINEISLMSY